MDIYTLIGQGTVMILYLKFTLKSKTGDDPGTFRDRNSPFAGMSF